MSLGNLMYVVCRSEAEYKTLSQLLPPKVLLTGKVELVFRLGYSYFIASELSRSKAT